MGKHETGYARAANDLYPTTPGFVVEALVRHFDLKGARVWEPACGTGDMAQALRGCGASVYESDFVDRDDQDEVLDFLSDRQPRIADFDLIVTNPPGGPRNKTAVAFVERGLRYVVDRGVTLALLLPADFDSAITRRHLFADCPYFAAAVVLTRRIVWFERHDGIRAAPKE
jgi:predicted RNA methylase